MRCVILASMLVGASVAADTEIYRCSLADGTIAFQETPCPEPAVDSETPAVDDDATDLFDPFDETVSSPARVGPALPEPESQDRAKCERMTRDAIDAIDLEMRQEAYAKEEGRAYLAELRELTQQLRACKQL